METTEAAEATDLSQYDAFYRAVGGAAWEEWQALRQENQGKA